MIIAFKLAAYKFDVLIDSQFFCFAVIAAKAGIQ
jgi:hypothetical protein